MLFVRYLPSSPSQLLTDVPRLDRDAPGFSAALVDARFVPTAAGSLAAPSQLFDPTAPDLRLLLDDSAFPAAFVVERPDCMVCYAVFVHGLC